MFKLSRITTALLISIFVLSLVQLNFAQEGESTGSEVPAESTEAITPESTPETPITEAPTEPPATEATETTPAPTEEIVPEVTEVASEPIVTATDPTPETTPEATAVITEVVPEATPEVTAVITEVVPEATPDITEAPVEVTSEPTEAVTENVAATEVTPTQTPETIQLSGAANPILSSLPAPTARIPLDGAVIPSLVPRLSWNAVSGAVNYRVDVATDAGFNQLILNNYETRARALALSTRIVPELPQGRYYWRLQASDVNGNWTGESATYHFDLSWLRAPRDESSIISTRVNLAWQRARTAISYRLLVDNHSDFSSPLVNLTTNARTTTHQLNNMDFGVYYWRVDVEFADGWETSPIVYQFTVTPRPLRAPSIAPLGITTDTTPTISWQAVPSGASVSYDIQVATDARFRDIVALTNTTDLDHTLSALPDGLYYVRGRTLNYLGAAGSWGRGVAFTLDTTAPNVPTAARPQDNSATTSPHPTFSWSRIADAANYEFRLNGQVVDAGRRNTYRMRNLPIGVHTWSVRATDAAGNVSEWSDDYTLLITPYLLNAPRIIEPRTRSVTTDTTPTISWNAVPDENAVSYDIEIASDIRFSNIVASTNTNNANYTSSSLRDGTYYVRVRTVNYMGAGGRWSGVTSVTIDTTAPQVPTPQRPVDESSTTSTRPAFSWSRIADAASYDIRLDGQVINVGARNIYRAVGLAYGTHTWSVRATDASGNVSEWSAEFTFIVTPPPLNAPRVTAPTNRSVTTDTTPTISWNAVPDADSYDVEIASDTRFTNVVASTNTGGTSYTPSNLLDGTYYIRIRTLNYLGAVGRWSSVTSVTVDTTAPTVPSPVRPIDKSSSTSTSPTLTWTRIADAASYDVRFNGQVMAVGAANSYRTTNLTFGTQTWSVRATDAAGNVSEWSAEFTFIVTPRPLNPPTVTSPVTRSLTNDATPAITWTEVTNADSYDVEIASDTRFTNVVASTNTGGTSYTPSSLSEGTYYIRIRTLNYLGAAGGWSAVISVTVDTTAPTAPSPVSPVDESSSTSTSPTLTWTRIADAASYDVRFNGQVMAVGAANSYRTSNLTFGTQTWSVRATDAAGNVSEWSAEFTFIVTPRPLNPPTVTSPVTRSLTNDATPAITWTEVTNADSYEIEIATDTRFTNVVASGSSGTTNFTSSTLPSDTIYYVRVRTLNFLGAAGNWSRSISFTLDTIPPDVPQLIGPVDGATTMQSRPTFTWNAAAGAVRYDFRLGSTTDVGNTRSYRPNNSLGLGTHNWSVRAVDAAGNVSAWSQVFQVSIPDTFEEQLLYLVNEERCSRGLHPLVLNNRLNAAAERHSIDMAENMVTYISHTGTDDSSPWDRMRDAGYNYNAASENVAAGQSSTQAVFNAWMNSDGHRRNILATNVREMGMSLVQRSGTRYRYYWTQVFGRNGSSPQITCASIGF